MGHPVYSFQMSPPVAKGHPTPNLPGGKKIVAAYETDECDKVIMFVYL